MNNTRTRVLFSLQPIVFSFSFKRLPLLQPRFSRKHASRSVRRTSSILWRRSSSIAVVLWPVLFHNHFVLNVFCGIRPGRWLQLERFNDPDEDSIREGTVISSSFNLEVSDNSFKLAGSNRLLLMSNSAIFPCPSIIPRGDCQHQLFDFVEQPLSRDRKSVTP